MLSRREFLALPLLASACRSRADAVHPTPNLKNQSPAGDVVRLFCAGDVMTGRGLDQILPYPLSREIAEPFVKDARDYVALAEALHGKIPRRAAYDYPWGDALKQLAERAPDLRLVNLETSITTSDQRAPKEINYRMSPANAACLTALRIDCVSLANNHVLDWGPRGLTETLEVLHGLGIRSVGAGNSGEQARSPAIFELGNKGRVLVFGFALESSGVPRDWASESGRGVFLVSGLSTESVRELAALVSAFKQPGDLAIASLHWGANWGYRILARERSFAHALIDDAQIDLLHGHSSHHPKAIECYRRKLILYGCGDFVNDYEGISGNEKYRPNLRLMYFPKLRAHTGELIELEITVLESQRLRLRLGARENVDWICALLRRESTPLASVVELASNGTVRVSPA